MKFAGFPCSGSVDAVLAELKLDLKPTLECPPKWRLLMDVYKEINAAYNSSVQSAVAEQDDTTLKSGRVLLIAKDVRTIAQLRDVLMHGDSFVMEQRFRWFISQQAAAMVHTAAKARCASIRVNRTNQSKYGKKPPQRAPTAKRDTETTSNSSVAVGTAVPVQGGGVVDLVDDKTTSVETADWELPEDVPQSSSEIAAGSELTTC